ncbi:MAG: RNA polymerase sigma-70 factor [Bacteroidota bacterium]
MVKSVEHIEFKKIFEKYYNPLCNYAASIIKDSNAAEDLVQRLFVQLWEKQMLHKVENKPKYLIRSTKFKCIDYLRSRKIHSLPLESIPEPVAEEIHLEEDDIIPLLHFFASSLPPKTKQVFLLSRIDGYSNQEIAEELNISVKTVENQMTRALKHLRKILKEHHYLSLVLWTISSGIWKP